MRFRISSINLDRKGTFVSARINAELVSVPWEDESAPEDSLFTVGDCKLFTEFELETSESDISAVVKVLQVVLQDWANALKFAEANNSRKD